LGGVRKSVNISDIGFLIGEETVRRGEVRGIPKKSNTVAEGEGKGLTI